MDLQAAKSLSGKGGQAARLGTLLCFGFAGTLLALSLMQPTGANGPTVAPAALSAEWSTR